MAINGLIKAVSDSKSLRTHNRVSDCSRKIAAEETNFHRDYRTTLSQLRSSFCSSLHSYRERIGLTSRPLCPSCGVEPDTIINVLSCSLHPTPMTKRGLWERSYLASISLMSRLFSPSLWTSSFWQTRDLGAIVSIIIMIYIYLFMLMMIISIIFISIS